MCCSTLRRSNSALSGLAFSTIIFSLVAGMLILQCRALVSITRQRVPYVTHSGGISGIVHSKQNAVSQQENSRQGDFPSIHLNLSNRINTSVLHQSSNPSQQQSTNRQASSQPQFKNTGGLRRLPVVPRGEDLIRRAERAAWKVQPDKSVKNAKLRVKKQAAETLDAISKELCVPLKQSIQGYKAQIRNLHPFERVVTDLTVRSRQKKDGLTMQDVLDDINEARKELLVAGRDWIAKAKDPENTARDASAIMDEGKERLVALFRELAIEPLDSLIAIQKSLRTVPSIQLDTPAVVLVGCPNVGKSSIVRAISSATPEVNNYPFTTRAMTLGHVEIFWDTEGQVQDFTIHQEDPKRKRQRKQQNFAIEGTGYAFSQLCQIMDSPGLLVREEEQRNEMEELTLAAMRHLPTAVMYVMDLSGEAGDKCSSVEDQLILRREIRSRFPRRPWIDVVSKVDLGIVNGALDQLESILESEGQPKDSYILLSIQQGTGVDDLQYAVMNMLGEVKVVLDAMAAASATIVNDQAQSQQKP